jgi:hypothetical protein
VVFLATSAMEAGVDCGCGTPETEAGTALTGDAARHEAADTVAWPRWRRRSKLKNLRV